MEDNKQTPTAAERQMYKMLESKLNSITEGFKNTLNTTSKVAIEGAELVTIKGEQGEKGERGEQGERGDDGHTPTKGEVMGALEANLSIIENRIADSLKPFLMKGDKGNTGEKGRDGKNGTHGMNGKDGAAGMNGKDGSSDTADDVVKKLLTLKRRWLPIDYLIGEIAPRIIQEIGGAGSSQSVLEITTDGTSGASTLIGNVLNIPQYSGGGGGSAIIVQDEGITLTSALASLNFVGAGVTATTVGNDVTVTIPGGSSGSGDVVGPASAVNNNFAAFDTTTGKLIKDSGSKTSDFATAAQGAKVDFITVTQAVNLDTMESDIATNNAKVGITAGQASNIITNNAKVGITAAQASNIITNNAKVGITAGQASDITANNAKVTNATHTGDATGGTALTVVRLNGTSLAGLATGLLRNTTGTGVPSIAINSDLPVMSATVGGAVPTPPNNTTTFLRGDGTFAIPAGGGGSNWTIVPGGLRTSTTTDFAQAAFFIASSTTDASTFAGNVGIRTTSPTQTLDIGAGSMALLTTTNATSGIIFKGANPFIHDFHVLGTTGLNTFVGINAGNLTTTNIGGSQGSFNTGIGASAPLWPQY